MSAARLVIPAAPEFDFERTIVDSEWSRLPPFHWDSDSSQLTYVYETDAGQVQRVLMRAASQAVQVDLPDSRRFTLSFGEEIQAVVKRALNMDWDLAPFYALTRQHADYQWIEAERRGRILVSPSLWENLVKVRIHANANWGALSAINLRFMQLGTAHPTVDGYRAFPKPQTIAALDFDEFAESVRAGFRTPYLHELAHKISHGEIDLGAWRALDSESLFKAVKSLKGFGDYAAATIALMLGHFDHFAIGAWSRTSFAEKHNDGVKASDEEIEAYYARFGGFRELVKKTENMR